MVDFTLIIFSIYILFLLIIQLFSNYRIAKELQEIRDNIKGGIKC